MDKTQITSHVGRNQIGDRAFQATALVPLNCLPRNIREAHSNRKFLETLKIWQLCLLILCFYNILFVLVIHCSMHLNLSAMVLYKLCLYIHVYQQVLPDVSTVLAVWQKLLLKWKEDINGMPQPKGDEAKSEC